MGQIVTPLTGTGDATAAIATDVVGGAHFQRMKLFDGTEGSSIPIVAKTSAPNANDPGVLVRTIGQSTILSVNGTVGLTSGSSAVELTSAGSTRLVGRVTIDNPTTAVTVTGAVAQGAAAGSSDLAWWVRTVTTGSVGGGSTVVDANLSSGGSTKIIGMTDGEPFSSGAITRATANSSAEAQIFAANANRKYATITNLATAASLLVGMSTGAVSTAGANAHFIIPALQTYTIGGQLGNIPRYTGPLRVRVNSTSVAGPVVGVEYV